jgi:hypothetical protein
MISCSNPTHNEMDQTLIFNNNVHKNKRMGGHVSLRPSGGENNKSGSIFEHRNQGFKEKIVNFDTEK